MKLLKKTILLTLFVVVMTLTAGENAKAKQMNVTEPVEWGKAYSTKYGWDYVYDMKLQQSGKVTITINIEGNFDTAAVDIFDSSDQKLFGKPYLGNGMHTFSIELLAGDYKIIVYNAGGSWIPSFTASGETVTENYMKKNNQLGTASSFSIGQVVKAQLAENDSVDIYKFTVNKTGYLTMNFTSNLTLFDMEMVSTDGEISYNEYDIPLGTSSYKYFVTKGTYYVSFKQKWYSGNYTFNTKLSGLTTTKVKTAKNLKGKKAKITWAPKTDVDGYQVQVALNKKFSKGKKTQNISISTYSKPKSCTFTKLKKKKTYYARIRTYKLVNSEKYYSSWSSTKKFKVKK